MAGALFARVKIWIAEVLYSADLNAEIQNILDKFGPQWMDDYSASVAQMQLKTSPGAVGSESQATSLAGELERIRYVIARIIDSSLATHWYEVPDTDLRTIAGGVPDLGIYLSFEPTTGIADVTSAFRDTLTRGCIANALTRTALDFTTSHLDTTASKVALGKVAYKVGGGILAFSGKKNNPYKLSLSAHFRNLVATDYIAFNPLSGHELYLDASGFLTAKITERVSASESVKSSSTVVGPSSRAGVTTYRTVLMKFRGNDIEGASTDLLELEVDDADEGTQLSAQDLDLNGGDGGVWFFGAKRNDPSWDHNSAMHVLPESHSSPWTKTGAGSSSVSGGILSISTTANQVTYNRATLVDLSQQTVEFKMRVTTFETANVGQAIQVFIRDDSMNRSFVCVIEPNGIAIGSSESVNNDLAEPMVFAPVNTFDWHQYRLTFSGGTNPVVKLYVDGVFKSTVTLTTADATAADIITFGTKLSGASTTTAHEWEYFRIFDAGATPPVAVNTASDGYLDDIAVVSGIVDAGAATKLLTLEADVVYGQKFLGELFIPETQYDISADGSYTDGEAPLTAYIVGDGRTALTFDSMMKFLATVAGDLTFVIQFNTIDTGIYQSLYDKITVVANNDFSQSILKQRLVPPLGLTTVKVVILSAATGAIDTSLLGPMVYGITFSR